MDGTITHQTRSDDRWCLVASALVVLTALAALTSALVSRELFDAMYAHSTLVVPLLPVAAAIRAWRRADGDQTLAGWPWVTVGVIAFFAADLLW